MRHTLQVRSLHIISESLKASFPPGQLRPAACAEQFSAARLTLSPGADGTGRRQQHPTGGDPDLSGPYGREQGPRCHPRAPGAPSASPRWVHVARWPHSPGGGEKSPGVLEPVLCTRLLLLVGDGMSDCTGREREREKNGGEEQSTLRQGGEIGRPTVADNVPNTQGGVGPIKLARLSSA